MHAQQRRVGCTARHAWNPCLWSFHVCWADCVCDGRQHNRVSGRLVFKRDQVGAMCWSRCCWADPHLRLNCFLLRGPACRPHQLPSARSAAPVPMLVKCALLWYGNVICCSRALQILHSMLRACSPPSGILCTPRLTCFVCLRSCDTAAPSPSWVTRAPMQAARGSLAAAVVHNTIYTMGGGVGQQHLSVCEG